MLSYPHPARELEARLADHGLPTWPAQFIHEWGNVVANDGAHPAVVETLALARQIVDSLDERLCDCGQNETCEKCVPDGRNFAGDPYM